MVSTIRYCIFRYRYTEKQAYMKKLVLIVLAGLTALSPKCQPVHPYVPVSKQDRQTIEQLLVHMTTEEKAQQLASFYPNGNTRLQIPHMQAGECLHGVVATGATSFPQAIALGSSWDTLLVERVSAAIAEEARALGIQHVYTPMLGVVRDARWGRFEEGYSEDPYLVSRIGVAFVHGLQGRGRQLFDRNHVMATAKHFVADGEPLLGANGAAVEISLRTLHEVHLAPFKAAVQEAQVAAIMPAHHSLNGVPCHVNTYTLNDILRKEYGFEGLVVSDNNDIRWVQDRFHITGSRTELIKMALGAGVHAELAFKQGWNGQRMYGAVLVDGIKKRLIPVALLDNAVRKVLQYKFLLKLQDDEVTAPASIAVEKASEKTPDQSDVFFSEISGSIASARKDYKAVLNNPAHDSLAYESASKSIILLKNDHILPLNKTVVKTIAVIGPNADTTRLGTYSTQLPKYFITVKQGIEKLCGSDIRVLYAKGCDIQAAASDDKIAEAVAAARQADICVVVLGDDEKSIMENVDRDDIALPGPQEKLLEAVTATGKPVILVLLHGRPAAIQWAKDHVSAIIDGWFLGQETGNVVAETIFGSINPGGKLTVTYPRNVGQVPAYYNVLAPGRPRQLWNAVYDPTYPFGYGLSYTTFNYSAVTLSKDRMNKKDTVMARVTITNTGTRTGDEIVQLYIRDEVSSLVRPDKELKGFARITLQAGESKIVSMPVTASSLQFWKDGRWITEPGYFSIMVGTNSLNVKTVRLLLQ